MGSQGEEEGGEETLKPRAQSAMSPPPREWGGNRCRGRLARRSALTWRASVCTWRRHRWKWTKEKLLPTGPEGPAAVGVLCSVEVRAQVGGGDEWAWGKGRGQWERSCPVPEGNCSLMRVQAARVVTAPPLRTPARCPLLPPSPAKEWGHQQECPLPTLPPLPALHPELLGAMGHKARLAPTPPCKSWLSRRGMSQG